MWVLFLNTCTHHVRSPAAQSACAYLHKWCYRIVKPGAATVVESEHWPDAIAGRSAQTAEYLPKVSAAGMTPISSKAMAREVSTTLLR